MNQDELQQQIEALETTIAKYIKYSRTLFAVGVGLLIVGVILFVYLTSQESAFLLYCKNPQQAFADIGTYVGGVVGSFWALAGVALIYVAFKGQQQQMMYQRVEIMQNQEALETYKEELHEQKEHTLAQNKLIEQQRFESTYFQLLQIHSNNVNATEYSLPTSTKRVKGRAAFDEIVATQFQMVLTRRFNVMEAFHELLGENKNILEHYFRHLYNSILFVIESGVVNERFYINILISQLNESELELLFYYGMTDNGKIFKPLIEEYTLLENLSHNMIHDKQLLHYYFHKAYQKPSQ